MQLDQQRREQIFDMLIACKENYLIVYTYVETNRGNIRESCKRYNTLLHTVLQARQLTTDHYSIYSSEELAKQEITYKPGRVKKIRKQLKRWLSDLHVAIQELLNTIDVEGGCFTFYIFNNAELKLVDYAERERQQQKARAEWEEKQRIDALLRGKPCEESINFLKANATTTEYVDKSTGLTSFYYTYGNRHYDPDGSFIGLAKIIKRGMDELY